MELLRAGGVLYPMRQSSAKPRIIVTCPRTGVVAITRIAYDEMVKPRATPMLFPCPCGETHKLRFAGRHIGLRRAAPVPLDSNRAS